MRETLRTSWARWSDGDPRLCWSLAGLAALLFGHGLLFAVDRLGWGDWDYFTAQSLVARRSWLDYGQAPFWTPYHCGGAALTENFQSRAWSPSILLVLALGVQWGNRLWMLLALALGFEGARRLARTLGAGPAGALFLAFAVVGNGAVTSRIAIGHFGDIPYLLLPWWLCAYERAAREPWRGALHGGLWGALCYLEAGIYPVVYGGIIAFACAFAAAIARRSFRPLFGAVAVALATLGFSMHVLLPSTLFTLEHISRDVVPEVVTLPAAFQAFFSTDLDWRRLVFPEQHWRWHEYATYVGPVFALGVVLAALRADRRAWGWFALGAFFFAYGLGDFASLSPWTLLHDLPVFRTMRASGRAFIPAVHCFAVGTALVLDRLRAAPLLAGAFAASLAAVSPLALHGAFSIEQPDVTPDAGFTQRIDHRHYDLAFRHHTSRLTLDVRRNRGSLSCYDPVLPKQNARALWPKAPEVLLRGAEGTVRFAAWSPNRLRIEFSGISGPGEVLVNQNHHPGWRALDARPVGATFGVITVPVRPGDRSIELVFVPRGFYEGLFVVFLTLLTLVGLTLAAARSRRRAAPPPDSPSVR